MYERRSFETWGKRGGRLQNQGQKNLGTGEAGREKKRDFLFYIHTDQMNILCLQNHHDV